MDNLELIYKNENLNNINDENLDIKFEIDKNENGIDLDGILGSSVRNWF